jgi:adenine/guanine phosphoribosyltransferase-like PRPP-binding protein
MIAQATGGTAGAACKLVLEVGAVVAEVSVFIELKELDGTKKLPEGTKFWSMYQF